MTDEPDPHANPQGLAKFKANTLHLTPLEVYECAMLLEESERVSIIDALEYAIKEKQRKKAEFEAAKAAKQEEQKLMGKLDPSLAPQSTPLGKSQWVPGVTPNFGPSFPQSPKDGQVHHDPVAGATYVYRYGSWHGMPDSSFLTAKQPPWENAINRPTATEINARQQEALIQLEKSRAALAKKYAEELDKQFDNAFATAEIKKSDKKLLDPGPSIWDGLFKTKR